MEEEVRFVFKTDQKKALDPWELDMQVLTSFLAFAGAGTKLGSPGSAVTHA